MIFSLAPLLLLLSISRPATASQRSIQLDSNGHYKGVVVGFSEDFEAHPDNRETIVTSIMVSEGVAAQQAP